MATRRTKYPNEIFLVETTYTDWRKLITTHFKVYDTERAAKSWRTRQIKDLGDHFDDLKVIMYSCKCNWEPHPDSTDEIYQDLLGKIETGLS